MTPNVDFDNERLLKVLHQQFTCRTFVLSSCFVAQLGAVRSKLFTSANSSYSQREQLQIGDVLDDSAGA